MRGGTKKRLNFVTSQSSRSINVPLHKGELGPSKTLLTVHGPCFAGYIQCLIDMGHADEN